MQIKYFRNAHGRNYFQPEIINNTSWRRHMSNILEGGQDLGIQKRKRRMFQETRNNMTSASKGRIKQELGMPVKVTQCSLAGAQGR